VWQEGITAWIAGIVIPIPSEFVNSAFTVLPCGTTQWRSSERGLTLLLLGAAEISFFCTDALAPVDARTRSGIRKG
jgi:hypothetical protein